MLERKPGVGAGGKMLGVSSLLLAGATLAQAQVVSGRIRGPDAVGVPHAIVTVVSLPDSAVLRVAADTDGRYSIHLPRTPGRFVLIVTAPGFLTERREIILEAGARGTSADFSLTPAAQRLAAVTTRARRPRPARSEQVGDIGPGQNRRASLAASVDRADGLSGDVTGDISSALAFVPGVIATRGGAGPPTVSVFGMPASQNAYNLNGMALGASAASEGVGQALPRDGFRLEAIPSTYDPGVGGFAGMLVSLRFPAGRPDYTDRTLHYTLDAPALQSAADGTGLGSRYEQHVLSGTASGAASSSRLYNVSYQVLERRGATPSLGSLGPDGLTALGISVDSLRHLSTILTTLGLPARAGSVNDERVRTASAIARFDYKPTPPIGGEAADAGFTPTDNQYSLLVSGAGTASERLGGPTSFATIGDHASSWQFGTMGTVSRFFFGSVLNELSGSLNVSRSEAVPFLELPGANVLLDSRIANDDPTRVLLRAGGSGTSSASEHIWMVELKNQTAWYTWDRVHLLKVTLDGGVDHYAASPGSDLGTFTYSSLSSLAQGLPAEFKRTLTSASLSGHALRAAVAVGDIFSPHINQPRRTQIQIQYGVRGEATHFQIPASPIWAADSAFGLRTDRVPNSFGIIPIIGFSAPIGSFQTPDGPPGPRGFVFGGVREYRGSISTAEAASTIQRTGSAVGLESIDCVGSAVPVADWRAFDSHSVPIPESCATAGSDPGLAQVEPSLRAFSGSYQPQSSWRAALGWSGTLSARFATVINTNFVLNRHQPERIDRNFSGIARFANAAEDGRPVYVNQGAIVPTTGMMTPANSRLLPTFGSVYETRSDLRGQQFQATIVLFDASAAGVPAAQRRWREVIGYSYAAGRNQSQGFGGTTSGDPRQLEWVRSAVPHHTITLGASFTAPGLLTVAASSNIASGFPFTPLVGTDINGDGLANDRAFVFDPRRVGDSSFASGMRALLDSKRDDLRCLRRVLNSVAPANSCDGPWTASLNLSLAPDPYAIRLGNRGTLRLVATNVLGGLDQLLHGSRRLRGWGALPLPNTTLLNVRGFDTGSRQFLYTANPSFGRAAVGRSAWAAPFRLSFDARVYMGPDPETESIIGFLTGDWRDRRPTQDEIKNRLAAQRSTPIDLVLGRRASLELSEPQTAALAVLRREYSSFRDSIYSVLAAYLISRDGNYRGEDVRRHWHDAVSQDLRRLNRMWPRVREILSAEQYQQVPSWIKAYWEQDSRAFDFSLRGPLQLVR